MNLRHITIGRRMAAGLAVILCIACALLGLSVVGSARDRAAVAAAIQQANAHNDITQGMHQSLLRSAIAVRNLGLQTDVDGVNRAEAAARQEHAAFVEGRKQFEALVLNDEGKALFAELTALTTESDRHLVAAVGLAQQFNQDQSATIITTKIDPLTAKAEAVLLRLGTLARKQAAASLQATERSAHRASVLLLGAGGAGLALAVWVGWAMTRSITLPLQQAVEMARRVASGDLQQRSAIHGRDEASQLLAALNAMSDSLSGVVRDVRSSSDSIATGSAEIASGGVDLSARTEQQASALQQTAASMEQLGSTVRQTAGNAQQASRLAQGASEVAARGGSVVAQVVDTMKAITDSSRRVNDIVGVIDGIAFQTNILALNAAVEAARAGEQGRGFAVVASEVRSLAQRSAEAAREIKRLIATSAERVEAGNGLVRDAGDTMQEIVASIGRVTAIIAEISAASGEQSGGVTQMEQAVTQMDQATQQNAALVEESAAAAESLKQQAQQLVQAVAVFRLPPSHA